MAVKPKKPKPDVIRIARGGKDEMNLAEFPTAILTTRSPDGVKTLRFHDSHGQLTVTGSDALGLPTPIDNDVMVALIELTKQKNNFTEEKVNFTRYELIRLIGWANVGSSYERLKEALDRWAGVLLIYDGCWWDNRMKQYVSKTVHIIEDIVIADGKMKTEKDGRQESLPLSSFTWSGHFMESFQANNLKSLDTGFYFSLKYPTSKQLFRFLDKRFANHRTDWTFDLEELAFERVGLTRNYQGNASKIKEKLGDALAELEGNGFLIPLPRNERYFKAGGIWKIRLMDGRSRAPSRPAAELVELPPPSPQVAELISRGICDKIAADLVRDHDAETIRQQIEILDWRLSGKKADKIDDPAAWLVSAIRNPHAAPKGFVSAADRQRQQEVKQAKERAEAEERQRQQQQAANERTESEAVAAYRKALTPEALAALEADAIAQASEETRQALDAPHMRKFRKTMVHKTIDDHIRKLLSNQPTAEG